jgi:hypothetical protein
MRTANRQIFRIAPALLVLAITLLQPVPEARADFDKRTEGYTYKSPIPDIIKEPAGLPDDMRRYGTRSQLKATILKGEGDDSFDPDPQGHSHNY